MIVKMLILFLIIIVTALIAASLRITYLLSYRNANVNAIFSYVKASKKQMEIRDRKWEDRKWLEEQALEEHSIEAFDGVKLKAKYVRAVRESEYCAIVVHGFHGNGFKEFSTIGRFYLENGINVLFVDQRGNGESAGRVITYGDREQKDILDWLEYAKTNITENKYYALHGISMGSSTVTLLADRVDSEYVRYIAADCGYTSEKEQLLYTIKEMRMPAKLLYNLYSVACVILGLYNPNKIIPIEHVSKSRVPMLFAHGRDDQVVPVDMAKKLFEACPNKDKKLVIADDANHTQAFFYTEEYGKGLLQLMFRGDGNEGKII